MELLDFSLLGVFVLMVSISLLKLLFYKPKFSGGTLPPGNTGWPVIGESIEFIIRPRKFIRDRMAKYSPNVFKTSLLGEQFAVLCGAAGNKFLFSNENKLVQVWLPSTMDKIFPYSKQGSNSEEECIKLRKMLPNFLKPNMLERYIGTMDQITQQHFASNWEEKDQVVVYPLTKRLTFSIACRLFLSLKDPKAVDDLAHRFSHIAPGLFSTPIDFPGTPFWRAVKAANYIRKKLLGIITQRKIELGEGKALHSYDILSHMLLTSNENREAMSDLDISDKILGLLVGGHDTTNSACASIVKYLAELPDVYERVYKEQMDISKAKSPNELLDWDDIQKMKYSWNVICEVLRLAPPVQGTFRESISDFEFSGFLIPKGWKLHWNTNSTHMNPYFFAEPEKFDPSRFEGKGPAPFTFVPFGGGPRMCPGKEYARLELLVFVHHLVKRFKWELLDPHEKIIVNPMPVPVKGLPVYLYPHKE